jgi:hypothetical protein
VERMDESEESAGFGRRKSMVGFEW